MNKIFCISTVVSFLLIISAVDRSFADKAIAQVFVSGKAELKTKVIQQGDRNVMQKYYWVDISLQNDGEQSLFVKPENFTIVDSLGTYRPMDVSDIPSAHLLKSSLVQERDTIHGLLAFQFSSNEIFPKDIIYETTSTIAFGKVTMVMSSPRTSVKEETPYSNPSTPTPAVRQLSPQEVEAQWVGTKAAKEATVARDSVVGELEMDIVNKYIQLQDNNKNDFDAKKITFDQFMSTKDNLDKQKEKDILSAHEKGQAVFNDTYSRITANYYQQKSK